MAKLERQQRPFTGVKPRNAAAKALEDPRFHQRVIKSKKGKGSYNRRPKHRDGDYFLSYRYRLGAVLKYRDGDYFIYPGSLKPCLASLTFSRVTHPSTWSLSNPIACMKA